MEVALPQTSFLQPPKNLLMGILCSYLNHLATSIGLDSLGRAALVDHLCKVEVTIGLEYEYGGVVGVEDAGSSAGEFVNVGRGLAFIYD